MSRQTAHNPSAEAQIDGAHTDGARLEGAIERVVYRGDADGFCVLSVRPNGAREPVRVVGKAASVHPGQQVRARGQWVDDRQYGRQLRAQALEVVAPSDVDGIRKYLGSGMVPGIGPELAKRLVKHFGVDVLDVIEQAPERLEELPGIGSKRRERIAQSWQRQREIRRIMLFLQSHGIGTARATRIYKRYGDRAIERITENPYRLAEDIHGIGFQIADELAREMGVAADDALRLRAGIRYTLEALAGEGHCAAERSVLLEQAASRLGAGEDAVASVLEQALAEGVVDAETVGERRLIYLPSLRAAEQAVADELARLAARSAPWEGLDRGQAMRWVERRTGLALAASQREAVASVLAHKVAIITGGPGVGKTTVVNSILAILAAKGFRIELAAPTGRAAKRLSEQTGQSARTLHRLLAFDAHAGRFRKGPEEPLEADLLIVDEASMVDVRLMQHVLRALRSAAGVLLVGDVDQLPSVGPGAVLADIIASARVTTARLSEIHRQAAASRIVVNAHSINAGKMPETAAPEEGSDFYWIGADSVDRIAALLFQVVLQRIPARFGLDPLTEVQVLTPMNRGPLGTQTLNGELQARLNPGREPRVARFGTVYSPGDKVIQTVNDYDKESFNGDIGRVVSIDTEAETLAVSFDGREVGYDFGELDELALAYAITVHKSQGSEYPAVVIPVTTQHYTMLERNLLYTGVTRGRRLVVLIGQTKALSIAVRQQRSQHRVTGLCERVRAALDGDGPATEGAQ